MKSLKILESVARPPTHKRANERGDTVPLTSLSIFTKYLLNIYYIFTIYLLRFLISELIVDIFCAQRMAAKSCRDLKIIYTAFFNPTVTKVS